jgi:hypothetical protein
LFGLLLVACGTSGAETLGDAGGDAATSADAGAADGGVGGGEGGAGAEAGLAHAPLDHRPSTTACPVAMRDPDAGPFICEAQEAGVNPCQRNGDCTKGLNGICANGEASSSCFCQYDDCNSDSDCAQPGVCACSGGQRRFNKCATKGNCITDSDCATGYCSPGYDPKDPCTLVGYYCHTTSDQCIDDKDCTGATGMYCVYDDAVKYWHCAGNSGCPFGR